VAVSAGGGQLGAASSGAEDALARRLVGTESAAATTVGDLLDVLGVTIEGGLLGGANGTFGGPAAFGCVDNTGDDDCIDDLPFAHAVYEWLDTYRDHPIDASTVLSGLAVQTQRLAMLVARLTDTLHLIQKVNDMHTTYTLALNEWSGDESPATGFVDDPAEHTQPGPKLMHSTARPGDQLTNLQASDAVPASVNWVEKGVLPPIINQGKCGSCWSISASTTVGAALAIDGGPKYDLSVADAVQCATTIKPGGCDGGTFFQAYQWIHSNGLPTSDIYPYSSFYGETGVCQEERDKDVRVMLTSPRGMRVPSLDEAALLRAVARQPVAVAIVSNKQLQAYRSGIFDDPNCNKNKVNHAVVLVGFGTDTTLSPPVDYWIMRNSWGTSWGEKGYAKIRRGTNVCNLASQPAYPVGALDVCANYNDTRVPFWMWQSCNLTLDPCRLSPLPSCPMAEDALPDGYFEYGHDNSPANLATAYVLAAQGFLVGATMFVVRTQTMPPTMRLYGFLAPDRKLNKWYAYGRLAWGLGFLLKGLTEQFLAKGDVNTISMFVAVPHNKIVIPWYGSEVTSDGQYVWSNQHCWDTAVVATGWAFWTLTGVAMVFAGFLQLARCIDFLLPANAVDIWDAMVPCELFLLGAANYMGALVNVAVLFTVDNSFSLVLFYQTLLPMGATLCMAAATIFVKKPQVFSKRSAACAVVLVATLFTIVWASLTQFEDAPLAVDCASPCPESCVLGPNFNHNASMQLVYILLWLIIDVVEIARLLPTRLTIEEYFSGGEGGPQECGKSQPTEATPLSMSAWAKPKKPVWVMAVSDQADEHYGREYWVNQRTGVATFKRPKDVYVG